MKLLNALSKKFNGLFGKQKQVVTFDPKADFGTQVDSICQAFRDYLSLEMKASDFAYFIESTGIAPRFVEDLYGFMIDYHLHPIIESAVMTKALTSGKPAMGNFIPLTDGLDEAQQNIKRLIDEGTLGENYHEQINLLIISPILASDRLAGLRGTNFLVHEKLHKEKPEMICSEFKKEMHELILLPTTIKDEDLRRQCVDMVTVDIYVALVEAGEDANQFIADLQKRHKEQPEEALLEVLDMVTPDNVAKLIPEPLRKEKP